MTDTSERLAWLIEWPICDNMPARWWHCQNGWMIDANKATWFCRKSDAESLIVSGNWGVGVVATEHIFVSAPSPAQENEKE